MNKSIFSYLKSYSSEANKIDRLIVSAFLMEHGIARTSNKFINERVINKNSPDWACLLDFHAHHKIECFENLISLFEFVISPEDKVVNGAVYTPESVRSYIVNNTLSTLSTFNVRICDPACGCSGFLYSAALHLRNKFKMNFKFIFENNLFGLDTQVYSITRSKVLLSLLAIVNGEDVVDFKFNLFHGNALNFDWASHVSKFNGFDAVIGNPPYVCSRNIEMESRALLSKWRVCDTGRPDLYIPFFELGVEILKSGGVLGYITMNTFFRSINGRALRVYFGERKYSMKILDFGGHQVFQSKSAYTCICFIGKFIASGVEYVRLSTMQQLYSGELGFKKIAYDRLDARGGWVLHEQDLISKIESTGKSLGSLFKSRNGIATLKNEVYVFSPSREDSKYYTLSEGEIDWKIEKDICRDIVNSNKLTSSASVAAIKEKIIFPYVNATGVAVLIDERRIRKIFPCAYNYLCSKRKILASRDKGNGKYENWYAYGRNQSLDPMKYKLLFPHVAKMPATYFVNAEEDLLFYNGMAILGKNRRELLLLKKIMSSKLFLFYIKNSSKPYNSDYFSLARNYIKGFGVCSFTKEEEEFLLNDTTTLNEIDKLLEEKYGISLPAF